MKLLPTLLALAATLLARAEVVWHDAATLAIEGRGWADTNAPFARLPAHARERVPEAVWGLSRSSAGIAVRFHTTADKLDFRWDLTSASLAMPHMPATGVSGLDLYVRENPGTPWRFIQNGRPTAQAGNQASATLGKPGTRRECLLYLPLYNGVTRLGIGADSAHAVTPATPVPSRRPVVIYGTSIVQGGCASRPGLAFPALLSRKLDQPFINLGFSGAGRMEEGVVATLAELDPAAFVIDCLWNLQGEAPGEIEKRVTHLARTLRAAHPHTPIVFVGQSEIHRDQHPTRATQAQESAIRALQKAGLRRLHLIPGKDLIGTDTEGTVDRVHPNDLGMVRHADALAPILKSILAD